MAASLEELLKEEGFKGKRLGASRLSTSQSQTVSMPLSPYQHKENSPSGSRIRSRMRTARSKSNIPQYIPRGECRGSDTVADRRPRDDFFRRNMLDAIPKSENRDTFERRDSNNLLEGEGLDINSLEDIQGHEIIEIGVVENGRRKHMHSNQIYNSYKSEKNSRGKEKYKESPGMELVVERILSSNLNKNLHISSSVNYSKSMKQTDNSYDTSFRRSQNRKSIKDNQGCKSGNLLPASEPALDDAAIQAMISILSGHMKHFLKVEGFRSTLHHNCFSSLKVVASEECPNTENKVITNLEQAIETIERAAEGSASHKDIKKALLQLTVITGLNSNDLKDGVTSGVLNSSLSACAHLYISVIYKLQKKDRASAKHLLQVFCDSPFGARTILLPELWDYLFFPHLSHLDAWYNQEAESLANSPRKSKRLKLLEKVFNEILDSGTYQYAIYYKDWLTEGVEVPSVPSIPIPSLSIEAFQPRDSLDNSLELASSTGPFSPQPMVSKKLYDAVFGRLRKPDTDEAEDEGRADYYDNCGRSSDGSVVEVKQALEYSSVTVTDQKIEEGSCSSAQDKGSFHNDALLLTYDDEEGRSYEVSVPPENDLHDDAKDPNISLEAEGYSELLRSHPHEEVNGSTLKKLTKSIFELQETQDSHDLAVSVPSASPSAPAPDSSTQLTKTRPSFEELHGSYEYFDEDPFLLSIPPDFICALTGQLFQDPVTLETGQTFEKSAIRERFDHGNRTCPITGKTLECQSVPLTNFILKRVVDSWKAEQSNLLLTLASQIVRDSTEQRSKPKDDTAIFILEPLLTAFGRKEGVTHARQLISFGGLQFLICRFECGKLEEKTCVAALLSHCIEADASCRNQIAEKINKQLLLELLHCQQEKTRTNAVLLLSELICFSRRKDAKLYLSSFKSEELINTMHVLLEHLQRLKPEQRPLVAVLLLHIDLLGERRKYSLYREGAIDAIRVALFNSLTDEKVRQKCCRSLLILGARFSSTGVLLTELWILKRAGIYGMCDDNWKENYRGDDSFMEDTLLLEDDEDLAEWLRDITISLLGTGKSLFLETMSYCLHSQELELVGVCLTTVAWMSCALSSHSEAALILSAFPALISGLKDVLENGQLYEHKVLASFSLLNFSKIPECKILLMKIAEEIAGSLRMVAEVSSAAKQLHAIICGEQRSVI